jgi:uncharacterized protein (TIGR02147 family)
VDTTPTASSPAPEVQPVPTEAPNAFAFTDLPSFLAALKERPYLPDGRRCTFERLGEEVGVESRTRMRRMFRGSLAMPKRVLERLADIHGLPLEQRSYLHLLRMVEQIGDPDLALGAFRKAVELRRRHGSVGDAFQLQEAQLVLLERWHTLPVLFCFDLPGIDGDPETVARAFHGKLGVGDIRESIEVLLSAGALNRAPDGRLHKARTHAAILDHLPRALVKRFHAMIIDRAQDSIYGMPEDKRFLMAATLPVRSADLPRLRKRIEDFVLAINEEFSSRSGDSIEQFSVQLFNLASTGEGEES